MSTSRLHRWVIASACVVSLAACRAPAPAGERYSAPPGGDTTLLVGQLTDPRGTLISGERDPVDFTYAAYVGARSCMPLALRREGELIYLTDPGRGLAPLIGRRVRAEVILPEARSIGRLRALSVDDGAGGWRPIDARCWRYGCDEEEPPSADVACPF